MYAYVRYARYLRFWACFDDLFSRNGLYMHTVEVCIQWSMHIARKYCISWLSESQFCVMFSCLQRDINVRRTMCTVNTYFERDGRLGDMEAIILILHFSYKEKRLSTFQVLPILVEIGGLVFFLIASLKKHPVPVTDVLEPEKEARERENTDCPSEQRFSRPLLKLL